MDAALKKKWADFITRLTISVGKQLDMERDDQILMMMCLNTPNKILKFVDWTKTKTVNNRIQSTPEEVMHIVTLIAKEKELPD